jgi:hypothetical protein
MTEPTEIVVVVAARRESRTATCCAASKGNYKSLRSRMKLLRVSVELHLNSAPTKRVRR